MRRLLFLLTLALYGFSALELHEWARVPQVVMHFLEQHTSEEYHTLCHADHGSGGTQQAGEHDHTPFDEDCHGEFCACSGMVALPPVATAHLLSSALLTTTIGATFSPMTPGAFSGNVWNPPKA